MNTPELREVPGIVWDGFYNIPDHVPGQPITLDRRAHNIAKKILASLPLKIGQDAIKKIVTQSYFKSLEPNKDEGYDPVHASALAITAEALKSGWTVFIWTIGDTGVMTADGSDLDPTGNCQRLKLSKGEFYKRLKKQAPEADLNNLIVNTSAEGKDKEPSFREICGYAQVNDFTDMYVADDQDANRNIVERIRAEFHWLNIHFYKIQKKDDTLGNIDAYREFIVPIIRTATADPDKAKHMLVLDLDEVIIDTTAIIDRTALLTCQALANVLGLKTMAV